jgi:hypothetical protein
MISSTLKAVCGAAALAALLATGPPRRSSR